MRIKWVAMALVAALTMGVVGCGDGEETATSASAQPAPLQKELAREVNALCDKARIAAERKGLDVFRSKASYYERSGTLNEFRGSLRRQEIAIVLAPSLRRRIGEVRDLLKSKSGEPQAEEALEAIGAAAKTATENPAGFLESGGMGEAREIARRYGIESCAVLYEPGGIYDRGSASPGARFAPRSSK